MLFKKSLAIGRVLLFWAATMVALALGSAVGGNPDYAPLVVGSLTVPVTIALTLLFIRWEDRKPREFGLELTRASWFRFAAGVLFGLLLIAVQTAIMAFAGRVHWTAASPSPATLLPILGYLLLATREELAFRGYPLRLLTVELRPWTAQIIVAAMFIVEHKLGGATWENAVLGSGLGSLVFGMAALVTRGLALPIGIHAAWNIGDWARGGKGSGGLWRMVVEPDASALADKVAMGSYVAVMLCALASLWWVQHRARETVA
ncbi:MAG TPA: type II CAAX endopeptidase family protein [Sphingomicrobium sp.]|jgi:membrane protease YdiL (CAAX protease family)|nr:type II CAAX endopeptidase family protein [Sphingomicrobium sp.]